MSLSEDQRRRYARQLLLAEIGDAEQAALCAARVRFAGDTDAGAGAVATTYLTRAGVQVDAEAGTEVPGPTRAAVRATAGRPRLTHAAEALLGALCAVETIKQITGVGEAGERTPGFTLDGEAS